MKPRNGASPDPAHTMIMGVEQRSTGGRKRCWPGRTEQLKKSPAFNLVRYCEARPRVGASSGQVSGAGCVIRDHVIVSDLGQARGEDEIEYCRGRIGGSIVASLCSGKSMLGYLVKS